MTTTSTRILRWNSAEDTESYGSLHDEHCWDLVYRVTKYYEAMHSGDAEQLAYAKEMLDRAECGYQVTFESNPRHIIDPQEPAVIAAHADLITPVIFNPEADAVAANLARTVDLHNDHIHRPGRCEHLIAPAPTTDPRSAYRNAYPSGPTCEVELTYLRRALSVWVITS